MIRFVKRERLAMADAHLANVIVEKFSADERAIAAIEAQQLSDQRALLAHDHATAAIQAKVAADQRALAAATELKQ